MENTLTIIIPAYNEEESIKTVLPEVIDFARQNNFFVILVNDGSKDNTRKTCELIASDNPLVKIINHKVNKGYGGAIKSGVMVAYTKYVITIDADGQHLLEDVKNLYNEIIEKDADMVVGSRKGHLSQSMFRKIGKSIIRGIAKWLVPLHIYDINSGMKIYNTLLAKKYINLCPDSMAYSDIIALTFISQRHLVKEVPINIKPRTKGKSTISFKTAIDTIIEIMNIVVLFNPMRIFLPISIISIILGFAWGMPIALQGKGVSPGALLAILTGIIFFLLGLIAEQLSMIRKGNIK
jgi:glycosyltransferase involved in cell wall biosynthesis